MHSTKAVRSFLTPLAALRRYPLAAVIATLGAAFSSVQATDLSPPPPFNSLESLPSWARAQKAPPKRVLVIGIGNYTGVRKLTTPDFDAKLVSDTLHALDPAIIITRVPSTQFTRGGLLDAIAMFKASIEVGDVVFVYYSGHGLETNGANYLVPNNASLAETGREGFVYVGVKYLIDEIKDAGAGAAVVILDACRTNPFTDTEQADILDLTAGPPGTGDALLPSSQSPADRTSATNTMGRLPGLAPISSPPGVIVAYAAEPGRPAYSLFRGDKPEQASIFTRRFMWHLSRVNKPLEGIFTVTGADVATLTQNRQTPFVNKFSAGEINLMANANFAKEEEETWIRTVTSPDDQLLSVLRAFVAWYPASPYTAAARTRIHELEEDRSKATRFAQTEQTSYAVLSGALQSPSVSRADRNLIAFAQRDVYVRVEPQAKLGQTIGLLKKGNEVQVLDGSARPGWAKVIMANGSVGYVGSVSAQNPATTAPELMASIDSERITDSVRTVVNDLWRQDPATTTLVVNVDTTEQKNPWKAGQEALLRGLRIRDAAIAEGVKPAKFVIRVNDSLVKPGSVAATISIVRGTIQ